MCTFDVVTGLTGAKIRVGIEAFKATGIANVTFTNLADGKHYEAVVSSGELLNEIAQLTGYGGIKKLSCYQAAAGLAPRLLQAYWDQVAKLIEPG
jgi:hypothetical protein